MIEYALKLVILLWKYYTGVWTNRCARQWCGGIIRRPTEEDQTQDPPQPHSPSRDHRIHIDQLFQWFKWIEFKLLICISSNFFLISIDQLFHIFYSQFKHLNFAYCLYCIWNNWSMCIYININTVIFFNFPWF